MSQVCAVKGLARMDVDGILQSEAFGLVSTYAPETQARIDRYDELAARGTRRSPKEESEFGQLRLFVAEVTEGALGGDETSLEVRARRYLEQALR